MGNSLSLSDLAAVDMGDQVELARANAIKHQFERRLRAQVERVGSRIDAVVTDLIDELVRVMQQEPLSVRRTRGLELLSELILHLYCPHLDDGGLKPLPLKRASEISEEELPAYSTYLPSTVQSDADARAELLLIGEAPAFAETKTGVPLSDLWNITASVCTTCSRFDRCFLGTVLVSGKSHPRFGDRLFGCHYEPGEQLSPTGYHCYTAGEILRQLLLRCGIARACWGGWLDQVRPRVIAVATNALRRTNLTFSASGGISNGGTDSGRLSVDAGWLWLEAAMMEPKATVLLGNVALEAFGMATGSRRRGSGVIDYIFPFGMVYKSYHPSALLRTNVILPWTLEKELQTALEERVERRSMNTPKWRARMQLVHLYDTLFAASRYVQSPDPMNDRSVGYADILPGFAVSDDERPEE